MIAQITRHLVRKTIKPFCLWLATAKQAAAESHAERYREMRADLVGLEREMRKHAVGLAERRNKIAGW